MADETVKQQSQNETADKGEAVHGVSQLRSKEPKATKLRNGVLFLVLVVICGLVAFIITKAKNRKQHQVEQTAVIKAGRGPATQQERSALEGMSRQGENVGSSHIAPSLVPKPVERHSVLEDNPQNNDSGMPTLRYSPNGANGQVNQTVSRALTPEEVELQREYELEQQALRAPMTVNTSAQLPGNETPADPMLVANQAIAKRLEQMGNQNTDPIGKLADALTNRNSASSDGVPGSVQPLLGRGNSTGDYDAQNKQADKDSFGERTLTKKEGDYQLETRVPAVGPYEVKANWLIPAVLDGELTSDLPGAVRAHVRENVYDSTTGKYLCIPQGSRLVGVYNSHVGYGQRSVQAVFTRIMFPDGSNVDLESDPGTTNLGAAGFHDKVDEHWKRLLGGALLTSLFAAGIQVSQGQNGSVLQTQSVGQQIGAGVGQQIGQVGAEVTRRNLDIQPTLRIRPGYRFFVSVAKDISFPSAYSPMRTIAESK